MSTFSQICAVKETPVSYFLTTATDETITKSLCNRNGKFGNIDVSATGDRIAVCERAANRPAAPIHFRAGKDIAGKSVVVDIDILSWSDDKYGLVVAMNEKRENEERVEEEGDGFTTKREKASREESSDKQRPTNNVYLYVQDSYMNFQPVRKILVYGEISCVRVLINPYEIKSQADVLSQKIASWPNVIAIGCTTSSCFIGQFADFDPWKGSDSSAVTTVTATTDALKALVDKNGNVHYPCGANTTVFKRDQVGVTAINYIPIWGIVLIGMSNGCIVIVPLDGKSTLSFLRIQYTTPISHLAVLEPEFDPEGGFFVFSAREKMPLGGARTALCIFSHKVTRTPAVDGGYHYPDMSTVLIPLQDGEYWLNMHTIVKARRRRETELDGNSSEDTSQLPTGLDTSQLTRNDGMDRTLLFFSYFSTKGEMKGGVFDLNAHYSRRCCTQQVKFDEYGQHPVCSHFVMEAPLRETGGQIVKAKDISYVFCESLSRYSSPLFYRDALFAPMAGRLQLLVYTLGQAAYAATVESLQITVLQGLSRNLSSCLQQPETALGLLEYTGLAYAATSKRDRIRMEERPANERVPLQLDVILRAVISEASVRKSIVELVEDKADRKQRLFIGRWMFNELRETVARLDEMIPSLFSSAPTDSLSVEAKGLLQFCPQFFTIAEHVFKKLLTRGIEMGDDSTHLRVSRRLHCQMAFHLRLFLAAAQWFTQTLPASESWTRDLVMEMENLSRERKEAAEKQGAPLYLVSLLASLYRKTMDDPLWVGVVEPLQWYPPPIFHVVSLLRLGDAPLNERTALILYYLMDADEVMRRDREKREGERKEYPMRSSLLSLFICSDVGSMMEENPSEGVRERWMNDWRARRQIDRERAAVEAAAAAREAEQRDGLNEEEKGELKNLLSVACRFRKLQPVDEKRMRVLMNKKGYGAYRFNAYLIRKSRFSEVEDLPVLSLAEGRPLNASVEYYEQNKEWVLRQKGDLPPPSKTGAFCCPYVITRKEVAEELASPNTTLASNTSRLFRSSNVTLIRGKTPKKLSVARRLTSSAAFAAGGAASAALMNTPPGAGTRRDEMEDGESGREGGEMRVDAMLRTPSMKFRSALGSMEEEEEEGGENDSDVAPDELARVREAMRTPRARLPLTGRRNGGVEGTPEDVQRPPMTAPMSILKSGKKDPAQSAMKSRLRFADVFDEKSISPRERDTTGSTIGTNQPCFDDSFEEEDHVFSRSHVSGEGNQTRLEREVREMEEAAARERLEREKEEEERREEEEESMDGIEGGEEEGEVEMSSMEYSKPADASSGDVMERGMEEEKREEEEEEVAAPVAPAAAAAAGGDTFVVYEDHSSGGVTEESEETTGDDVTEEDAAAAEEVAASAAEVADEGEEEEKEESESAAEVAEEEAVQQVQQPEEEAPVAAEAASGEEESAAAAVAADEEQPAADGTYVVAEGTFTVDLREGEGRMGEGEEEKEEEEEEERTLTPADEVEEEKEEAAAESEAAASAAEEVAAAAEEEEEVDPAAEGLGDEDDEEEEEEEEVVEEEEKMDVANISRGVTPVEGEEEGEKEVEGEKESGEVGAREVPMEEEKGEEEVVNEVFEQEKKEEEPAVAAAEETEVAASAAEREEEEVVEAEVPAAEAAVEEEEVAAEAVDAAPAAEEEEEEVQQPQQPPVPKPRTTVPAHLRAYTWMGDDGINRSYEEQRGSSDEEKEEGEDEEILSRVRRSGRKGGKKEESAMMASPSRRRGRKESEKDASAPSTSKAAEEREEGEGHVITTTRTSVVEERVVEKDGVMQHTVKQSTQIIETSDGLIVKDEHEERELIEEEGDREIRDSADRVTPPVVEAEQPATGRRSSRRGGEGAPPTSSRVAAVRSTKKKEEEKREEKESTPLRSPARSARRKKLMSEMEEKEEEKREEEKREEEREEEVVEAVEPMTPRRSTRSRKPSESASVVAKASTSTPTRRSTRNTPSREPSAAPHSPTRIVLNLDEEEEESKKGRRGTRKTPSREVSASVSPTRPLVLEEKKEEEVKTPSRRGRPRKQSETSVASAPAAAAAEPAVVAPPIPAKRRNVRAAAAVVEGGEEGGAAASSSSGRKRSASESGGKSDSAKMIEALRVQMEKSKSDLAKKKQREEKMEKRKTLKMATIPEGAVAAVEEKREEEGGEEASSSQAPPRSTGRRKRSVSEGVKGEGEGMKTPMKKKAKEEEDEIPQSVRRSTRKASAAAKQEIMTPAKTPKKK